MKKITALLVAFTLLFSAVSPALADNDEDAVKNCIEQYFTAFYDAYLSFTQPKLDDIFENSAEMEFYKQNIYYFMRSNTFFKNKYSDYSYKLEYDDIEVNGNEAKVSLKITVQLKRNDTSAAPYSMSVNSYSFKLTRIERYWRVSGMETDDLVFCSYLPELRRRVSENATVEEIIAIGQNLSDEWVMDPEEMMEEEIEIALHGNPNTEESKKARRDRHFELLKKLTIKKLTRTE